VVILGAGGGVGAISMQLARTAGVEVSETGRDAARDLVLQLLATLSWVHWLNNGRLHVGLATSRQRSLKPRSTLASGPDKSLLGIH
jgi:D-arabinose 1-dehydrogenase-like Zn-dependent alcohol dehydrogenase